MSAATTTLITTTTTAAPPVTVSTLVLSDKFRKELSKFFRWAETNKYELTLIEDGKSCVWNDDLIQEFKEPSRNKLEVYLRNVLEKYKVTQGTEDIVDHKFFAKEYKDQKDTKDRKDQKDRKDRKDRKGTKKEEHTIETSETINSKDTSDFTYIDTLPCTTEELVKAFGQPLTNTNPEDHSRYEWKVRIGGVIYNIYDWRDSSPFEAATWHIGKQEESDSAIKLLGEYLLSKVDKLDEKEDLDTKGTTGLAEIDFNDLEEIDFSKVDF